MAHQSEKRRYPRFPTELVTDLRPVTEEEAGETLRGAIKNLSLAGAFVETDLPIQPGDYVAFKLKLQNRPREVMGVVRWVQETPPGIGVQLSTTLRDQILRNMDAGREDADG